MLVIFFDNKGIVVMFYDECLNICKDFPPNFGGKKMAVASQRIFSHFRWTRDFFYQKQHDFCAPPTLLFCFSDWG
jgi:hypothetical protein